jgi:hypothetical protein
MSTGPNTVGQNQRSLLLNTWVEKCGFASNDVAYCAVPRTLPANAGLFREEFIDVENDIYRIDLSNGFRSLVATPDQAQGIRQLSVSSDERFLYYTGIQDNNIYQIRLR